MDKIIPSQKTLNALNRLSKSFKPLDVKFLVSNSPASVQECNDEAVPLITGLKRYVDNNHSLEGLDEKTRSTFGEIKVFKTKDRV